MTHADTWHAALRKARTLQPDRIAALITAGADTGLRATSYDRSGSRTTFQPCEAPEACHDGPTDHSHLTVSDPTGNAATAGRRNDSSTDDLKRLEQAELDFIRHANVVLDFVKGEQASTWVGVVRLEATLLPSTIQSGIDVDHEGILHGPIGGVSRAVSVVERIARDHQPRAPSQDEQHWTSGLADESVCQWHLSVHRRYRRPRVSGLNICQDCVTLAELLGQKPPTWLIEAMIDHGDRPIAWRASLSRAMDELGVARESA